jgi:hypothetical protein
VTGNLLDDHKKQRFFLCRDRLIEEINNNMETFEFSGYKPAGAARPDYGSLEQRVGHRRLSIKRHFVDSRSRLASLRQPNPIRTTNTTASRHAMMMCRLARLSTSLRYCSRIGMSKKDMVTRP